MKLKRRYMYAAAVVVAAILVTLSNNGGDRPWNPMSQPHHGKKGFVNPFGDIRRHGFADALKWMLFERSGGDGDPVEYPLPAVVEPDIGLINDREAFSLTWVGHSTVFIRVNGMGIVTDPVWSERASPVSFAGPKRLVPPGVPIASLGDIDLALISHNHYDHLDSATLAMMPGETLYLVPLGVGAFMERRGITTWRELDWWESVEVGEATVTCVPAQHFAARGLFDRNETLWCGWVVRTPAGAFYYAGDTGYFGGMTDITSRCGHVDVAILPVGAYLPEWFMGQVHLGPREAIRAFREMDADYFIPVHWGTFPLADDPPGLAGHVIRTMLASGEADPERVWLLSIGETRRLTEHAPSRRAYDTSP